jgi:hypothetical protein
LWLIHLLKDKEYATSISNLLSRRWHRLNGSSRFYDS